MSAPAADRPARRRRQTKPPIPVEQVAYLGERGDWHILSVPSSQEGHEPYECVINGVTGEWLCSCMWGVHQRDKRPEDRRPCRHVHGAVERLQVEKKKWA